MRNPIRLTTRRLHDGQLFLFIALGGILVHQAHTMLSTLHAGKGWTAWRSLTGREIMFSGLDYMLFGGVLVLLGIILVYAADARAEREPRESMADLLKCAEAAAAGDLSRVPVDAKDGTGRLAGAIGRLITVLGRSENLVYHLSTLVESSSDAIISHTLDGTILIWNKGAQRIYGYSAEEVKGKSIAMLSSADEGAEVLRHLERIKNGERIQPFETTHQARNGRSVKAFVRVSAILDSTRKVIGATFCAQELTDMQSLKPKTIEDSRAA